MSARNLLLVIFVAIFVGIFIPRNFPYSPISQSPSSPIVNQPSTSTTPIKQATTTANKPAVTQKPNQIKSINSAPVAQNILPKTSTNTPAQATVDFEAINQTVRKSVVNILCTSYASGISSISGTGVVVDPRGIILTNAHVGQYWLLKDYNKNDSIDCVVRTGSPAYPQYHAELMYISPSWVADNLTLLKEKEPSGTGENDFAFLHIIDKTDKSLLPQSFDYVKPDTREDIKPGENVVLVSYPAGFLGGMTILQNLFVTSAVTTIQNIFTFKTGTTDVVSVGGTVVSQKGASGGAVVDSNTSLIALITTSTNATTTSARELNAITLSHINRSIQKDTSGGLSDFLAQDPTAVSKLFKDSVGLTLAKALSDALK
jgi:hypothetical protein